MAGKKPKLWSVEDLEEQAARASMCSEVTMPGTQARELIRLALVGKRQEVAEELNQAGDTPRLL